MKWRDSKNHSDCGVYLMRHMETYTGDGASNWDCGLKKSDEKQLENLRVKYTAQVIRSEFNTAVVDLEEKIKEGEKLEAEKKGAGKIE